MKTLLVALAASVAAALPVKDDRPHWRAVGCGHGHGFKDAKRGIDSVLRSPRPLTRARGRRVHHFASCTIEGEQARRLHRYARRLARWRRSYPVVWRMRAARLSPYMKATLARLRGCETRGIPFPQNYQYAGHHDGAYQYTVSTWQRAQAWYPGRVVGWTSNAHEASPAHQDVVTAFFFPAHRSEWACRA